MLLGALATAGSEALQPLLGCQGRPPEAKRCSEAILDSGVESAGRICGTESYNLDDKGDERPDTMQSEVKQNRK